MANLDFFFSNHDASMGVIDMVDKITAAIDAGHYSVGIFIDLSKTLTHWITKFFYLNRIITGYVE